MWSHKQQTVDGIVLNLPSIDRMLMKQKSNKEQEVWVIKDHSVQELVKETCMLLMKQEWCSDSFKLTRQLAVTLVYYLSKYLLNEANVEVTAKEFGLNRQQLCKLVTGKKFKSGKASN